MSVDLQQLMTGILQHGWPFLRIGGMLLVMPAIGSSPVPPQARILIALGITVLVGPLVGPTESIDLASLGGFLTVAHELLLGIAMGFVLTIVFDAVTLGGQTIAMSMGLGFAVFLDRARGVNVPVLGQFFLILATLIFLALDGHLRALETLVASFTAIPIGTFIAPAAIGQQVLEFSSVVFVGAMQIALPAVTALLVANLAFGVMSRAAPTLNLFAVGFPVSLLFGLVVIYLSMDGFTGVFGSLVGAGLDANEALAAGGTR